MKSLWAVALLVLSSSCWNPPLTLASTHVWGGVQAHQFHDSSLSRRPSSSLNRPNTSKKRKRRRRRPPHTKLEEEPSNDWSSSSFVPLVFSEDEEEENIISALAREEEEEVEETDLEETDFTPVKRTVRKPPLKTPATPASVLQKEATTATASPAAVGKAPRPVAVKQMEPRKGTIPERPVGTSLPPSLTRLAKENGVPQSLSPPQSTPSATTTTLKKQPLPTTPTRSTARLPPHSVTPTTRTTSPPKPKNTLVTTPWVRNYLNARPRDALLPVPREYLQDGFNLVQLAPFIERLASLDPTYAQALVQEQQQQQQTGGNTHAYPIFKAALRLLLQEDETREESSSSLIERMTQVLFAMVHARYVVSPRGLDTVRRLLQKSPLTYGKCPRVACQGMPLLPTGQTEVPSVNHSPTITSTTRAKRFCACCGEIYCDETSQVDECAWGPSFCHLFLLTYGSDLFHEFLARRRFTESAIVATQEAAPSIFGFRLHPGSKLRTYPA